jgi:hypothetical protein
MAHFAKVVDGVVVDVLVVDNAQLDDLEFPESEPLGQAFLADLGFDGEWLQTSYNNQFRFWFASPGMVWDGTAFYSQPPGEDWTLDPGTYQWVNSAGKRIPER